LIGHSYFFFLKFAIAAISTLVNGQLLGELRLLWCFWQ